MAVDVGFHNLPPLRPVRRNDSMGRAFLVPTRRTDAVIWPGENPYEPPARHVIGGGTWRQNCGEWGVAGESEDEVKVARMEETCTKLGLGAMHWTRDMI